MTKNFGAGVNAVRDVVGDGVTLRWLDGFSAELTGPDFHGYPVRITVELTSLEYVAQQAKFAVCNPATGSHVEPHRGCVLR